MTRVSKQLFGGLCFLLSLPAAHAQNNLPALQATLSTYAKSHRPEKVFMHTDKDFYMAGELMWFKLYVLDGISHKPSDESKVTYVELLDKSHRPVSRAKIALGKKGSDGSIQLPFNLNSGHYTIRAYTNWMKNFGPRHFFEKKVVIVNTLKSAEPSEDKPIASTATLQLFPEGGHLVNGLRSKVAFHLRDKSGMGTSGKGYLLNAKNDTLSSFEPFRFGMGHFELTPQDGNTYKVVFQLNDGHKIEEQLPASLATGFTLQLEEAGNDQLKLTVKTNIDSGMDEVFILAQTRQVPRAIKKNSLTNGVASFVFDKKVLGEGVSQFTVFTADKKPVCERLYFTPPTSTLTGKLNLAKANYTSREKVSVSIDPLLNQGANVSLSVFLLDELQKHAPEDITHYTWLTSELQGVVQEPGYYFSANDETSRKATDYLMLTHGWRRFQWDAVDNAPEVLQFQKENPGHLITGRVTDTRTNLPAKNVQVFLSIPNSPYKLYTALSDSDGYVQFTVNDYSGQGEVIVQTHPRMGSSFKVDILSPFAETYSSNLSYPLDLSPSMQTSLLERSIGMQTQTIYLSDSILRFRAPLTGDTLPFYGRPIYSYQLDDYVRFNTMEEVMREYVREVNVGLKGSGNSLRFKLFNEIDREHHTDDILLTVDGIPFFNANKSFDLDPLKIRKLDIINRNFVFGNSLFHGLVNFVSYSGNYEGLALDPKAVSIDYEGLQLQREFYSPDYSTIQTRNSRLPDLRTTLLWVPNVTEKELQFYTSDNTGRYLILVQGVNETGQTISAFSEIRVN